MREIQAHHVNAGEHHALEDGGIGRGRAERGDDFRAAEHFSKCIIVL
jgi:hypothetical protein